MILPLIDHHAALVTHTIASNMNRGSFIDIHRLAVGGSIGPTSRAAWAPTSVILFLIFVPVCIVMDTIDGFLSMDTHTSSICVAPCEDLLAVF